MRNMVIFILFSLLLGCNKANQDEIPQQYSGAMRIKSMSYDGIRKIYSYNEDLQLMTVKHISSLGDTTILDNFEYRNGVIYKSIKGDEYTYYYNDSVVSSNGGDYSTTYLANGKIIKYIGISDYSDGSHSYIESNFVWNGEISCTVNVKYYGYDNSLDTIRETFVRNFNTNLINFDNVYPLGHGFDGNKYLHSGWAGTFVEVENGYLKKFIGTDGQTITFSYYYDN